MPSRAGLLSLLLLLTAGAAHAQLPGPERGGPAPGFAPSLPAQIDSLARAALAIDSTGGMTIGLVTDSGLAWTASYGFADMTRHTPATASTVYRIGSITKQFTALMLLRLVQAGRVHLSDPADRYLPAIDDMAGRPPGSPPVTLVELATMRSGLAEEPDSLSRYLEGPVRAWETVTEAALRQTRFMAEPDTRWQYSNIGYAALGAALERAARRPYLDYVPAEILQPLGMTHTVFELDSATRAALATGYSFESGKADTSVPERELSGRGYKIPNGGLFSTVGDLARFVAFELGNGPDAVLPRALVRENFTRLAWATPDLTQGYGIGFHVQRAGDVVAFGHPGSVAGYLATAYFDPASHTGVIVLRNVDDPKFDILRFTMTVLEKASAARRAAAR